MLPDLNEKLKQYVALFNAGDEECYTQNIPNAAACEFLARQIPLLDCPEADVEKTYYLRWWTLRKHWKTTPHGHILSEFLPPVPWAGPHNSINCAAGHHLREARWMQDPQGWIREYIRFWLDGHGDALRYSMWLISAIGDYLSLHPDPDFAAECLPQMIALFNRREEKSLRGCGLYWSNDGRDGMEYSISGSGIRPTLNAYMYGDACAISRIAAQLGCTKEAQAFAQKAARIKEAVDRLLWDKDFYRVIPCEEQDAAAFDKRPPVMPEHRVRELLGFVPWIFRLPDADKDAAFAQLIDPCGFSVPAGLATAEQRHPRFLFEHEHECLWNGYVWPFATSQTLTAVSNMLHDRRSLPLTRNDYYRMLLTYARSHHRLLADGTDLPWIDEVQHPITGEWSARKLLEEDGWKTERGGYERGKDYNHSTFCDLVLDGLLGIRMQDGQLTADPLIPESWNYFCVTQLPGGWTVVYDRTGKHYGLGQGLHCFQTV